MPDADARGTDVTGVEHHVGVLADVPEVLLADHLVGRAAEVPVVTPSDDRHQVEHN